MVFSYFWLCFFTRFLLKFSLKCSWILLNNKSNNKTWLSWLLATDLRYTWYRLMSIVCCPRLFFSSFLTSCVTSGTTESAMQSFLIFVHIGIDHSYLALSMPFETWLLCFQNLIRFSLNDLLNFLIHFWSACQFFFSVEWVYGTRQRCCWRNSSSKNCQFSTKQVLYTYLHCKFIYDKFLFGRRQNCGDFSVGKWFLTAGLKSVYPM